MAARPSYKHADLPAPISVGTRNLGRVEPVTWEWWEIGQRQSNPIVTEETFAEYQAMLPDDKNAIKNVGGYFFGAHCEGGRRAADAIKERTVITLDIDKASPDQLEALEQGIHPFCRYEFHAHTTRGHTPEAPRIRLTLLANRPIVRDEFEALLRILAYQIDRSMKTVDKVSWRWAQLMYWPSVSADMRQHFRYFHNEGDLVDVDAVLASWEHDWRDYARLPRDPDETTYHERQKKAENPREKHGWVGAFCRAYDVEDAIDEFDLPYRKSDIAWSKPRYTYVEGSGLNGAVVEDNGDFLYSNHGTDPVSERLVNAFDLVRIHKFGHLDKDADTDTPQTKLPSFKAMVNLIKDRPEVQAELDSTLDPTEAFEDIRDEEERIATVAPRSQTSPREQTATDRATVETPEADSDDDLLGPAPSKASNMDEPSIGLDVQKEAVESDKSPNQVRLEQMNRLHAVVRVAGKTVAATFIGDHIDFGSVAALHEWYANNRIPVGQATVPLSQWWMQQPERRGYAGGVTFLPGIKTPSHTLNLWRGWSYEPNPEGSCKLFLDHLFENVCKRDEIAYRHLIGWMADLVQNPGVKPGVAVVLQGEKGAGKDVVGYHLGQLFKRNYVAISEMDQLTGKFNAHFEQALLIHVEEGLWAGDKRADGALKSLITRSTISLERKGIDVIQIPNSSRIFITSNERWVVPATKGERRYFVLRVGTEHRLDRPYFRAIAEQMKAGGYGALMHFLQTYDLSGFDVGVVPDTEGLAAQKVAGLKNAEGWWREMLEESILPGDEGFEDLDRSWQNSTIRALTDALYGSYRDWLRERPHQGHGPPLSKHELGMRLKEMCPSKGKAQRMKNGARSTCHVFPPLDRCRVEFETYLGSKIEWPDDDDDLIG